MAKKMLDQYMKSAGYRYVRATLLNVPWAFALLTPANSLYKQYLYMDEPLYSTIVDKIPGAEFDQHGQLRKTGKGDLSIRFMNHKADAAGQESYMFVLTYRAGKGAPSETVFEKKITFDLKKFQRLIHSDRNITESAQRLLAIAREIIPDPESV